MWQRKIFSAEQPEVERWAGEDELSRAPGGLHAIDQVLQAVSGNIMKVLGKPAQ
jgi:hypothetical protein